MTKRTIKTGLGSYVDKRGNPTYGWQGDEVDVHEDFLEEFDAVNVENGDGKPVEYERVGVSVISPDSEASRKASEKATADAQKQAEEDAKADAKAAEAKAADEKRAAAKKA